MQTQLVIRLPKHKKALLANLAQLKGESLSALVRQAINSYLAKNKSKENNLMDLAAISEQKRNQSKKPQAQAPKDLSTNYKRYLYSNQ